MENNYIVINGVKYNAIETETQSCTGCCFNLDGNGCFRACYVFEDVLDAFIIMKKDGEQ